MGFTITTTIAPLADMELITADDMREIGLMVREQIIRRTRQGVDATGAPFQPYSAGYAKAKAKALGGGPVNLTVSGGMLNDLTITDVKGWPEPLVELGWSK